MAVIPKDGFNFFSDINGNPGSMIISGGDLDGEIKYIIENNISSIAITSFHSKSISNLEFLKKIQLIKAITIDDDSGFDYAGLYYLIQLKSLTLSVKNKRQHVDFSKFEHLEYLSVDWYSQLPDLTMCYKLKELVLWKYKPKHKSFIDLKVPDTLENLEITESNIQNLEGLHLPNLKKLECHNSNLLESTRGIESVSIHLNTLVFDYCKKLSSYQNIETCSQLEKIILGNCGSLPTVEWVKSLKKLKHFSFYNTLLLDGDTSPCFGIKYVSFKNNKNYNHKVEEFRK